MIEGRLVACEQLRRTGVERWIGKPVVRKEDHRFLTGSGHYTDDLRLDRQAHGVVVRSLHPHARIRRIDTSGAAGGAGVLTILTAESVAEDIPRPIPSLTRTPPFNIPNRDGSPMPDPSQPVLAWDKTRYLGEPVAFVVAETPEQARDAAERVEVDYEPLPAITEYEQALAPGGPRIWDEETSNVSFEWDKGDPVAVEAAMTDAASVVKLELVNNRIAPVFMEPRAALADYDAGSGQYTLRAGSQGPHGLRGILAGMLDIEVERLAVVTPDIGGGFGARGAVYPEYALVLVAARRIGRPVKWTADRSESFLSDAQARDHVFHAELALDQEQRFTALRLRADWRHGGYVPGRNIWVMLSFMPPTLGGVYRVPAAYVEVRGLFSNTVPQAAYRGIGRVEATYVMESLVDGAARAIGADPAELRRRNLVSPAQFPWTAAGGAVYHSGEFERNLDRALSLADWAGLSARRREAEARGRRLGAGIAMYVENDGGAPSEFSEIRADAGGTVTAFVGTQNFGMGHETFYAQVLADELGVSFESVQLVNGDTDRVARGSGSHGSRSARIGGTAAIMGARAMTERGREVAAEMLEAAVADIEYDRGRFVIRGTDRTVTLFEAAAFVEEKGEALAGSADFHTEREAHANGCHVCEVEVDPETGVVKILRYVMVADVGVAVNPLIVDGQLHGGAAQGIGQALLERVVYDPDTGQTASGSLMDYTLPRADDFPLFATELNEVAESDNPLGIKGVGESATTGAPPAVMGAIRDALSGLGVTHVDMPATPERVWQAIRDAEAPA